MPAIRFRLIAAVLAGAPAEAFPGATIAGQAAGDHGEATLTRLAPAVTLDDVLAVALTAELTLSPGSRERSGFSNPDQ